MTPDLLAGRVAIAERRYREYAWTNALIEVDYDRVRAQLPEVASEGSRSAARPLAGALFSVKDVLATAGIRSTAGSLVLADNIPATDAVVVDRLRRAGALLVGKGNCAEFAMGIDSENRLHGRVLHPFDPEISSGGSSGGDAVAVAVGAVDFSIGTDYGGSVRWPAQAVGVLGLRTGVGQVPRTGEIPGCGGETGTAGPAVRNPWSLIGALETIGILARTPQRIIDVFQAIRGPDGLDWLSGLVTNGCCPERGRKRTGRIALTYGSEIGARSQVVDGALDRVRLAAEISGLEVVEVSGLFADAFETYSRLRYSLDHHADIRAACRGMEQLLCEETRRVLEDASARGAPDAVMSSNWGRREEITRRVGQLLEEVDVVVLPVAPTGPIPFGGTAVVDGATLDAQELMAFCRAVSLTGLPTLSVPFEDATSVQAVSVQIVGGQGDEELCCTMAQQLGAAAGLAWALEPSI